MSSDFWKHFPPMPGFSCLKMKRDIQENIYEETKGMNQAQRLEYFRRGAATFRAAHARGRPLAVHEKSPPFGSDDVPRRQP